LQRGIGIGFPLPGNLVSIPYSSGLGLQPIVTEVICVDEDKVSIPYSSGLGLQPIIATAYTGTNSVSIPYSSGLGLQLDRTRLEISRWVCFNPLFIGSGFATQKRLRGFRLPRQVSIPYSSGLGLQQALKIKDFETFGKVSIPYSSGLGLQLWG